MKVSRAVQWPRTLSIFLRSGKTRQVTGVTALKLLVGKPVHNRIGFSFRTATLSRAILQAKRRSSRTDAFMASVPARFAEQVMARSLLPASEKKRGKKSPPTLLRESESPRGRATRRPRRPWQCGDRRRSRVQHREASVLLESRAHLRALPADRPSDADSSPRPRSDPIPSRAVPWRRESQFPVLCTERSPPRLESRQSEPPNPLRQSCSP